MFQKIHSPWLRMIAEPAESGSTSDKPANESSQEEIETKTAPDDGKKQDDSGDSDNEEEEPNPTDKAVEEWRNHSREWEKKAKRSLAQVEKLQAQLDESASAELLNQITQERDGFESQLHIIRTLFAIGADAELLTDSRSFMDSAEAIEIDDPKFEDKIRDLVSKQRARSRNTGGSRLFNEGGKDQRIDLYSMIHGSDK